MVEAPASPKRPRPFMAVILSGLVWPGAGQIYNGQIAKGAAIIAASAACGLAFAWTVARLVMASIPEDLVTVDAAQIQVLVEQVMASGVGMLRLETAAVVLIWVVSVVDAYLVARGPAADS